jgi:PXPV repeat (3 copies)
MMPRSEGPKMRKFAMAVLLTSSVSLAYAPRNAVAGSGEVAAGVVGGLALGTLFGAAVASGPRYYAPAPVYVAPAPVYVEPTCYWTRGAPVWDGYRGIWYRPRIQVCD